MDAGFDGRDARPEPRPVLGDGVAEEYPRPYIAAGPIYAAFIDADLLGDFDSDVGFYLRGGGEFAVSEAVALRVFTESRFLTGESESRDGLEIETGDLSLNLAALPARGRLRPYVGGGIGYSGTTFDAGDGSGDDPSGLLLRAVGGLDLVATDWLLFGASVSYDYAFYEIDFVDVGERDVPLSSLTFGLNVAFRF